MERLVQRLERAGVQMYYAVEKGSARLVSTIRVGQRSDVIGMAPQQFEESKQKMRGVQLWSVGQICQQLEVLRAANSDPDIDKVLEDLIYN